MAFARRRKRRRDEGSMPLALLVTLVGVTLSAGLSGLVVGQIKDSQRAADRVGPAEVERAARPQPEPADRRPGAVRRHRSYKPGKKRSIAVTSYTCRTSVRLPSRTTRNSAIRATPNGAARS